jgi:hypothetical protein
MVSVSPLMEPLSGDVTSAMYCERLPATPRAKVAWMVPARVDAAVTPIPFELPVVENRMSPTRRPAFPSKTSVEGDSE